MDRMVLDVVPPGGADDFDLGFDDGNTSIDDVAGLDASAEPTTRCTVTDVSLDIDSIAANYSGHSLIQRLKFIADVCPSYRLDALKLACEHAKDKLLDFELYTSLHASYKASFEEQGFPVSKLVPLDRQWITKTKEETNQKMHQLEQALRNDKHSSIKATVRVDLNDLGSYSLQMGKFSNAVSYFQDAKLTCNEHDGKSHFQIAGMLVKTAVLKHDWMAVIHQRRSITNNSLFGSDSGTTANESERKSHHLACIFAADGLAHFNMGQYEAALDSFLSVNYEYFTAELPSNPPPFLEPSSMSLSTSSIIAMAVFSAFLSLVKKDRLAELFNTESFRQFVGSESDIANFLSLFERRRFGQFAQQFDRLAPVWRCDVFLSPCVDALRTAVLRACVLRYVSPMQRVLIKDIANVLGVANDVIVNELRYLLEHNLLPGYRIDLIANIVVLQPHNAETDFNRLLVKLRNSQSEYAATTHVYATQARQVIDVVGDRQSEQDGHRPMATPKVKPVHLETNGDMLQ